MTTQVHPRFFAPWPVLASVGMMVIIGILIAGCDGEPNGPELADPEEEVGAVVTTAKSSSGADVERRMLPFRFGPAPLSAACLNGQVDTAPSIGGVWKVRFHRLQTPTGREHFNELLDYSDVQIAAGEFTWRPGPGAKEKIVIHTDTSGLRTSMHAFNARYLSQDALPDLRVYHRVRITIGPDGTLRHFEFTPFSATCLGG